MCVRADAKTLPGISQPFPEIFDPANLLSNATSVQEVKRWRESEITHGRVAMLAALGWLTGEFVADKRLLVNADGRITGEGYPARYSSVSRISLTPRHLEFIKKLPQVYLSVETDDA